MSAKTNRPAWRRMLKDPLMAALALSLGLHVAGALTWKLGDRLGWWKPGQLPKWVQAIQHLGAGAPKPIREAMPKPAASEARMTFIEVDPSHTTEPPKDAKYYGAVNARAANPEPARERSSKPKVDGREQPFEKVTENRPLTKAVEEPSKAFPLQPDFKAAEQVSKPSEKQTKAGDQKSEDQGETLMAKADPKPRTGATFGDPDQGLATETRERPRPRTLAEARARQGGIPGERSRMEGGASDPGEVTPDVKATGFGVYDARFVDAVRTAWFQAMGKEITGGGGDVQVRFNLHSDGRISGFQVVKSTVDELLTYYCRRAIEAPAPFEEWTPEMRREIGSNAREITFTFHYLR